jgi:CRISPR-associated endonuclease/helicase Cas3
MAKIRNPLSSEPFRSLDRDLDWGIMTLPRKEEEMNFAEYFDILYPGRKPYKWQEELKDYLSNGDWKSVINLPMAAGKTTIIEIWNYVLCDSLRKGKRIVPLRLWYVVDRKLLVDEAFIQAKRLEKKLKEDTKLIEFCKPVLDHFGIDSPLIVARLRGGLDRSEKNLWLTTPNQPTIITTTIDQYGSRLLFRGYGVNPKSRSIQAGLAAIDSLAVIDEAHISQPFTRLVNNVFNGVNERRVGDIPESRILEISATTTGKDVFKLSCSDPSLIKRTKANRRIELSKVSKKEEISDILIKEALRLSKKAKVIAIVCNTVKRAREVFRDLKFIEKTLIIGRIRIIERYNILKNYKRRLDATRPREEDTPLIVVCTQTIEVGANFDFDAMVTEAAPLDCLIQRFGRLNRFGMLSEGNGVIVYKLGEKDCIYGGKTGETIDWLTETYKKVVPNFSDIERNEDLEDLFANTNIIPSLTDQLKYLISHTHPYVEINIDGLLHGVETSPHSEISIVYRADITNDMLENNKKEACQWVKKMPPRSYEIVTVPLTALYSEEFGDTESQIKDGKGVPISPLQQKCVVYRNGKTKVKRLSQVRSEDVIIVPCDFGKYDEYGWNLSSRKPVEDVFHRNSSSGGVLCLHPRRGFDLKEEALENDGILVQEIDRFNQNYLDKGEVSELLKKAADQDTYGYSVIFTPDERGVILKIYEKNKKGERQDLAKHMQKVADYAKQYAKSLGLPEDLIDAVYRAGLYHDLGKADPRFQKMLYYPEEPDPQKLLAKSTHPTKKVWMSDFEAPRGWRHELQSVEMLKEENNRLIIHLVGSHHGWFRNSFHLDHDRSFQPFSYGKYHAEKPYVDYLGENYNLCLFRELNRMYGFWGLAFLEAIIRLADGNASKDGV